MLFEKITAEQAGLSSKDVESLLRFYERNGIVMHSLLLMKGDKLFGEYYWAPFTQEYCHRMYSQTKSYVGVAIGLLIDEGKISLDDKLVDFFPEKIDMEIHPYLKDQTIKEMLTMTTCHEEGGWFWSPDPDRIHQYLTGDINPQPSGTRWRYDSAGSLVLGAIVEKITGKSLFDYMDEKIFKHLGTFKTARILTVPTGNAWADSALLCTSRDMMSFGRFVMNYGKWEGKQLMSEQYLRDATSAVVGNADNSFSMYESYGYGYQIWRHRHGFSFNGLGAQFTFCCPDEDVIMVMTGDNCGYGAAANSILYAGLEEFIINRIQKDSLPADQSAVDSLNEFTKDLKIPVCIGEKYMPLQEKINGVEYIFDENPKFKKFSLEFDGNGAGQLNYVNAQGEKTLKFKMCENEFTKFPQLGYFNEVCKIKTTDGYMRDVAVSAGWLDQSRLMIRVQITDHYTGNMSMIFSFKDDYAVMSIEKTAENSFGEYPGVFVAKKVK